MEKSYKVAEVMLVPVGVGVGVWAWWQSVFQFDKEKMLHWDYTCCLDMS